MHTGICNVKLCEREREETRVAAGSPYIIFVLLLFSFLLKNLHHVIYAGILPPHF